MKSSNWQETQELIDTFRNDVVEPFLKLNTYAELNKSYLISSLDEAIKFTSMNEAFLFLNDTEEEVPKGYLTPTLDTILWRNSDPGSKKYLQETFKGYKFSNQYLWSRLLGNDFFKTSLTRIHETEDWFEFDEYFDKLRPIIDIIEKHLGITLGMAPVILTSKSAKSVLTKLIRDKAPTENLNEFEILENLFQWYQIELIDASSGKLDMDDLAPRIKELRACQHELQQQRDSIIGRLESDEPEKLEEDKVTGYVGELEQVMSEKSFLQQKAFLRRFVRRIDLNPEGFAMEYTIPLPAGNNRTSTREVLYFNKVGSAYRIRTGDLVLERDASWAARRMRRKERNGWGRRIRTFPYGFRVRCPTARRFPNMHTDYTVNQAAKQCRINIKKCGIVLQKLSYEIGVIAGGI